jgi:DNA-binding transcriptional ArsR family regulator
MVELNLDHTFRALADPTRRMLLRHLSEGERCVTDLARPHAMSLAAVSKHLQVLERAGLLSRTRIGKSYSLKLEAQPMAQAQQWMEELRKFWEDRFDRLDEYLQTLQADNPPPTQKRSATKFSKIESKTKTRPK